MKYSTIDLLKVNLDKEGIHLPFIPEELVHKLNEVDEYHFSTRRENFLPYDIEDYLDEVINKNVSDYCVIAIDGHGVNSWAFHYYLVKGPVAIFLQLGCGKIAPSYELKVDRINNLIGSAKLILDLITSAQKHGLIKKDQRLLIIESDMAGSGWGWIQNQPGTLTREQWHTEYPTLMNALNSIPVPA